MDDGVSFLGLGFSSSTSGEDVSADALMKHYLQQCLDYHSDRRREEEEVVPKFVSAVHHPEEKKASHAATAVVPTQPALLPPPTSTIKSTADAAHEAMVKARAIVEKFQMQQQQPLAQNDDSLTPPLVYRQRREVFYQKHRKRLHRALVKNFEYVARREEQRLQLQLAQIQETRQKEISLKTKSSHARKRQQYQPKPGIGTREVQKTQVAIYLSGLPVDGSMMEDSVRDLFASYGTIQRVHLYRNKLTGQLKGDALVVFVLGTSSLTNGQREFLDSVCSQMTGAQLPCGSILQVEPADSEYKAKGTKNGVAESTSYYGPSSRDNAETDTAAAPVVTATNDEEKRAQEATQDLDDFFASLT